MAKITSRKKISRPKTPDPLDTSISRSEWDKKIKSWQNNLERVNDLLDKGSSSSRESSIGPGPASPPPTYDMIKSDAKMKGRATYEQRLNLVKTVVNNEQTTRLDLLNRISSFQDSQAEKEKVNANMVDDSIDSALSQLDKLSHFAMGNLFEQKEDKKDFLPPPQFKPVKNNMFSPPPRLPSPPKLPDTSSSSDSEFSDNPDESALKSLDWEDDMEILKSPPSAAENKILPRKESEEKTEKNDMDWQDDVQFISTEKQADSKKNNISWDDDIEMVSEIPAKSPPPPMLPPNLLKLSAQTVSSKKEPKKKTTPPKTGGWKSTNPKAFVVPQPAAFIEKEEKVLPPQPKIYNAPEDGHLETTGFKLTLGTKFPDLPPPECLQKMPYGYMGPTPMTREPLLSTPDDIEHVSMKQRYRENIKNTIFRICLPCKGDLFLLDNIYTKNLSV